MINAFLDADNLTALKLVINSALRLQSVQFASK